MLERIINEISEKKFKGKIIFAKHNFYDFTSEDLYGKPSVQGWDGIHLRGYFGQTAYTSSVISILEDIEDISHNNEKEECKRNHDDIDDSENEYKNSEPPLKKLKENSIDDGSSSIVKFCTII